MHETIETKWCSTYWCSNKMLSKKRTGAAKIITKGKVCFWNFKKKQKDRECGKWKKNLLRLRLRTKHKESHLMFSLIKDSKWETTLSACCDFWNVCARNIWYTNPIKLMELSQPALWISRMGSSSTSLPDLETQLTHLECVWFFFP